MMAEPKNFQRLRLYGRPATEQEIIEEIAKLAKGDANHNKKPMNVTLICKTIGFSSRSTVYSYLKKAAEQKLLEVNQDGKFETPKMTEAQKFERFDANQKFTSHPLILPWFQNLMIRKQGNPLKSGKKYVRDFEVVLNTLKVNPEFFGQGLKESEKLVENFLVMYKQGDADLQYRSNLDYVNMQNIAYQYSKAVRDFMRFTFNLTYPKGYQGVMSQKVVGHGKFPDIRFSDEEFELADRFLKDNYGIDSDEYRIFWVAVESCSRAEALLTTSTSYVKSESKSGKITYVMTAYESKTEHIRGGKWTKYIKRKDTQKSIDFVKQRGSNYLYDSQPTQYKAEENFKKVMKKLCVFVGKIPNIEELNKLRANKVRDTGNYYYDHPIHFLRHIGAHYWLKKTKYNYGFVAKIGGWNTIDELKDSYGEMPPEVVMEILEETEAVASTASAA